MYNRHMCRSCLHFCNAGVEFLCENGRGPGSRQIRLSKQPYQRNPGVYTGPYDTCTRSSVGILASGLKPSVSRVSGRVPLSAAHRAKQ
jgi:hypothetical protein